MDRRRRQFESASGYWKNYYRDACAILSNSCFFFTDGAFGSLEAAKISYSAICSSIGLGLEYVESLIESAMNFNAMSTLRIGATSTDT